MRRLAYGPESCKDALSMLLQIAGDDQVDWYLRVKAKALLEELRND